MGKNNNNPPAIAAIILAAGNGLRIGGDIPKQYKCLNHVPIIKRTVENFFLYQDEEGVNIAPIIVVVNPEHLALCQRALGDLSKKVHFVNGGKTRQESTLMGLRQLNQIAPDIEFVHIHDGARPFVNKDLLVRIHSALNMEQGVIPALPIAETIKKVNLHRLVENTISRANLYTAQTPQSFPFQKILTIHEKAANQQMFDFTDDSALAEYYGLDVKCIDGDTQNIKITWQRDMIKADRELRELANKDNTFSPPYPDIRTGNGYDIHQLAAGDGVVLCGVKIPSALSLQGHSDADVGLHALTDALLATCGAGDIGVHFPPTDPQWKGVASKTFLQHAYKIIQEKNGQIINLDITLIAEEPKIKPHREAMVENLKQILKIDRERISIKATTNEKLGPIGKGEGIAAIATVNVFYNQ